MMPLRFLGFEHLTSQYGKTAATFRYVRSEGLSGFLGVCIIYKQPTTPYIGEYDRSEFKSPQGREYTETTRETVETHTLKTLGITIT